MMAEVITDTCGDNITWLLDTETGAEHIVTANARDSDGKGQNSKFLHRKQ
jgi:hypothetical protein